MKYDEKLEVIDPFIKHVCDNRRRHLSRQAHFVAAPG
jgi:hypothetical protein